MPYLPSLLPAVRVWVCAGWYFLLSASYSYTYVRVHDIGEKNLLKSSSCWFACLRAIRSVVVPLHLLEDLEEDGLTWAAHTHTLHNLVGTWMWKLGIKKFPEESPWRASRILLIFANKKTRKWKIRQSTVSGRSSIAENRINNLVTFIFVTA